MFGFSKITQTLFLGAKLCGKIYRFKQVRTWTGPEPTYGPVQGSDICLNRTVGPVPGSRKSSKNRTEPDFGITNVIDNQLDPCNHFRQVVSHHARKSKWRCSRNYANPCKYCPACVDKESAQSAANDLFLAYPLKAITSRVGKVMIPTFLLLQKWIPYLRILQWHPILQEASGAVKVRLSKFDCSHVSLVSSKGECRLLQSNPS